MNRIIINGKTFRGGSNVRVINSSVIIDGVKKDVGKIKNGILEVKVEGIIENLEVGGSVICEDVRGTVQAGGTVTCDDVGGNVQAGGSVVCDNIGGSVMAGGVVTHD